MIRTYKITHLLCIALITHSLQANAESCRRITNTINKDIIRYSGNIKNKHLPWTNLAWLQQQLGTANARSVSDTGTQYRWSCETDGSYLVAVVDKNGSLVKLRGQYNSDEGSGLFATAVPKSETPPPEPVKQEMRDNTPTATATPLPPTTPLSPPTPLQNSISDRVHFYNEHYKTNFKTPAEIESNMLEKIKHYYSNLRQCQPGTYEFPVPVLQDFLYHTANIAPLKDGHCRVKVSYVIPQIGNIELKCNYQPQSLQLYTDAEAEATARGMTKMEGGQQTPLQTVVEKECKRYIDGVL
jgi:hypothetical protein